MKPFNKDNMDIPQINRPKIPGTTFYINKAMIHLPC